MAPSLRDSLCSSLFQHTCILTQVILLGPCDNHVILILQIEKLRLHEAEPITQLCNKHLEELGLEQGYNVILNIRVFFKVLMDVFHVLARQNT